MNEDFKNNAEVEPKLSEKKGEITKDELTEEQLDDVSGGMIKPGFS